MASLCGRQGQAVDRSVGTKHSWAVGVKRVFHQGGRIHQDHTYFRHNLVAYREKRGQIEIERERERERERKQAGAK